MIRVVIFLIAVGLVAYGVALFADRPGDVVITWQGLRIETSLMVWAVALVAAMAALLVLWTLFRAIVGSPAALLRLRRRRRGMRAYEAISNGLVAVGAGDATAARKHADEVARIAPGEPLALLLSAQSAQLAGDRDGAERAFRAMAGRTDTRTLGLHGLFVEARRNNDLLSARAHAEEAARHAPALGWASRAVLEFRSAAGDWAGALTHLERNSAAHHREAYRRHRAVLLTARALAIESSDRDSAKSFALEANKLAPTLVPAAALAARLVAEGGNIRKASRIIDKAWRANPNPELAQVCGELRYGDSARDRLKRIEALAKKTPGEIEGTLAVARAALDAREFAKARAALAPLLQSPTKRVAILMAELERAEKNDEGRAREWVARALHAAPDPAWTADGFVSDHWLPASPVTGRLDAFEWRVPLAGSLSAPVIEPEPQAATLEVPPAPMRQVQSGKVGETSQSADTLPAQAPAGATQAEAPLKPEPGPEAKAEPIIPLVHAPDDPGPETYEQGEGQVEAPWRKIFG